MSEKVTLTPQQAAAVDNRGGALLVSAAAGSGKTKVLVERLIKRVIEEGEDIDSFLVITFTNAAAAELRGKIIDAITEKIAEDPGNIRLHRQFERCYRAKISTIHSFCSEVIRQNAHAVDVSPDFTVIDETQTAMIKNRALDDVLERRYSDMEEGGSFALLADMVATGRSDRDLVKLVLNLYDKMQMNIDPVKWVRQQKDMLFMEGVTDAADTIWGKELINACLEASEYWLERLGSVLDGMEGDDLITKRYGGSMQATYRSIEAFKAALCGKWDDIREVSKIDFPKVSGVTGYEDVKNARRRCREEFDKIGAYFDCSSDELISDMRAIAPVMAELLDIALEFGETYGAEKRRRGVIDFSDQEHFALKILTNEDGSKSEIGRATADSFTEILVDEYQDINPIQEALFNAVSKDGNNIFMVGDVKQSIYRFRLADPGIFIKKYLSMKEASAASEGEERKIVLSTNFRSRAGVLAAVNYIFENIMSRSLGEIDYDEAEHLYPGLSYPENGEGEMEIVLVNTKIEADPMEDIPAKTEIEADAVAEKILHLKNTMQLSDGKGGLRAAEWGDFTILLRAVKGKAGVYAESLEKHGIPVSMEQSEDFFQSVEIVSMLSLLTVVDNPRQDIPLISTLRSFMFGFSADELAEIRVCDRDGDFYDALIKASETSKHAAGFLEILNSFRKKASEVTADELIWDIYMKTGAIAIAGAMADGESRQANLMALLELARNFESDGYKGLFGFISYLREAEKNDKGVPVSATRSGSAVSIASIHKSKGLEYPVVILADTAKQFYKQDIYEKLLIHEELGLGPKITDVKRKIRYPSLSRMAASRRINSELLSEEMRILYVAMTRAREKLVVFASFDNVEKRLSKLAENLSLPLSPRVLENSVSLADWIIMASLMRKECRDALGLETSCTAPNDGFLWSVSIIDRKMADDKRKWENPLTEEKPGTDEGAVAELKTKLGFKYTHSVSQTVPSKITATELKGSWLDFDAEDAVQITHDAGGVMSRPDFNRKNKPLTGAERGTALHIVMQFIDYAKCTSLEGIEGEIERLRENRMITDKQAQSVDPEKILRLFESDLGRSILESEMQKRELKFSVLIPANRIYDADDGDEILLQGVIDCLFGGEKLTIIDYKTDYVTSKTIKERTEFYRGQLNAYRLAVREMLGSEVERAGLYFFSNDTVVWL